MTGPGIERVLVDAGYRVSGLLAGADAKPLFRRGRWLLGRRTAGV
jgi:hypothetical protein